ncbi:MAG: chaperone modulator CbpM [Nitrospirales bacterium]
MSDQNRPFEQESMNSQEPRESIDAHPIGAGLLRAEELCVRLGLSQETLDLCLRWEVVQPADTEPGGVLLFSEDGAERIRRGLRLHHDLGINWAGVAVILDLLDRLETLERHSTLRRERRDGP